MNPKIFDITVLQIYLLLLPLAIDITVILGYQMICLHFLDPLVSVAAERDTSMWLWSTFLLMVNPSSEEMTVFANCPRAHFTLKRMVEVTKPTCVYIAKEGQSRSMREASFFLAFWLEILGGILYTSLKS